MNTKLFILILAALSISVGNAQNSYYKTWDIDFSGGNNGNFSGLDASDVAVTFNAVDSKMQVEVNKVVFVWSHLNIYMGNCWTKRIVFDQANRYIEFRIKSSVALTDIAVNPKGGPQDGCPKAIGKTWPTAKFSITDEEVDQWKIVLLKFAPTTGGTQNILDTMDTRLTWSLPNGSYTFDYVKIGECAIPPTPVIDQTKAKTVKENAGQQNVLLTGIDIPNRTLDGLTIEAETEKDGILKDISFVDLTGNGTYIDTDAKTATLRYTPVVGMGGQSDNIIVTLKDTIRGTETKMTFAVNLLLSDCSISMPVVKNDTICYGNRATLVASGGTSYYWYSSSISETPFYIGSTYTTPNLSTNTSYYVSNYNGSCESNRTKVLINILGGSVSPSISALQGSQYSTCSSVVEKLVGTPSGGIFWGDGVEEGYFIASKAKGNALNTLYYGYSSDDCTWKDSTKVYVFGCKDNLNETSSYFTLSPNPATNFVKVNFNSNQSVTKIQIIDAMGKVVYEKNEMIEEECMIAISHFASGMYVVKTIINNETSINKFIKE